MKQRVLTLHSLLTRLIWLCVLPLVLLAIYLAGVHVYTLQAMQDSEAHDRAYNLAVDLDNDLSSRISALQALSASPLIDNPPRLKEFYNEAQGFRDNFSGHVILADTSMQMIFNTRVPFGDVLPKLPQPKGHAAAPYVLSTGKPSVGDMFFGPIAKEPLVAIVVPVIRNGKTKGLLLSIIETRQFQQRIDKLALSSEWRLTLLDGKGDVMARRQEKSKEGDQFDESNSNRFTTKLTASYWSVVLEIPVRVYRKPIISTTALLIAAILIIMFVSVLAGRLAGRRLTKSMATLTKTHLTEPSYPSIAEIEEVRATLNETAAKRNASESALRESEELLRLFVEHSPAAIAMFDRDMRYIVASRRFLTDYNLSEQNIVGRSHYELLPEIPERWKEIHRRCLAGAIEKCDEDPFPRADGSIDWVRWEIHPWRKSTSEINGIILFSEVITERKKAEEELKMTNEELIAINKIITTTTTTTGVKEILEKVLDEALNITGIEGGTICMITPDETLHLAVHRETSDATILDLTTNEIIVGNCLCGECARDHKSLILKNREEVLKFSTREAIRGEDIRFHAAYPLLIGERCLGVLCVFTRTDKKPADRRLKLLETVTSQIAIAVDNAQMFEEISHHAATLEDKVKKRTAQLKESQTSLMNMVDDLSRKTEELRVTNERLKELDRLKSMFIASMSHELRTPLNSIIGFSSILLDEWTGPLNDEQKQNLAIVLRSGKHLLALINDVIDVSKIEAGTIDINVKDFDLYDVIKETLSSFEKEIKDKGLELEVESIHQIMHTDRRRLIQCVTNLVSNAIKFTEKGLVRVQARMIADFGLRISDSELVAKKSTIRNLQSAIEISVSDTGIGIKDEDIALLFQPFIRLESPLKAAVPGTGLGLYLTKKLVTEALKGDIMVESTFGKGSRFVMRMPVNIGSSSK